MTTTEQAQEVVAGVLAAHWPDDGVTDSEDRDDDVDNLAGAVVRALLPQFQEPAVQVEQVDHPAHYGGADSPYEAIKVIEAWQLDFCLGNAVKYISRAGKKGAAIVDLHKARWYIDRAISQAERQP